MWVKRSWDSFEFLQCPSGEAEPVLRDSKQSCAPNLHLNPVILKPSAELRRQGLSAAARCEVVDKPRASTYAEKLCKKAPLIALTPTVNCGIRVSCICVACLPRSKFNQTGNSLATSTASDKASVSQNHVTIVHCFVHAPFHLVHACLGRA